MATLKQGRAEAGGSSSSWSLQAGVAHYSGLQLLYPEGAVAEWRFPQENATLQIQPGHKAMALRGTSDPDR